MEVTMSHQSAISDTHISLDSVYKDIKDWRKNKHTYDTKGIPDPIWISIFKLEEQGFSGNELRRTLGLNSKQYNIKHAQLTGTADNACEPKADKVEPKIGSAASIDFSEAIISDKAAQNQIPSLSKATEKAKQAIKQLKSTNNEPVWDLDNSTIIVECVRPDGYRLKIHTTNCRLDIVMKTFFNQEVAHS